MEDMELQEWFEAKAAYWAPQLGTSTYKPLQIQAYYLPSWRVDAEISARFRIECLFKTHESNATIQVSNGRFPGLEFPPLSSIPFELPYLFQSVSHEPVPWSSTFERQHGMEINCLQYTSTPLRAISAIHHMNASRAQLSEDLQILHPSASRVHLLAAYPVLLPVYIAQYPTALTEDKDDEKDTKPPVVTYILDASRKQGHVFSNAPSLGARTSASRAAGSSWYIRLLQDTRAHIAREKRTGLAQIWPPSHRPAAPSVLVPAHPALEARLRRWAAEYVHAGEADAEEVDMDDPRVRAYTQEEKMRVEGWMQLGQELVQRRRWAERSSIFRRIDGGRSIRMLEERRTNEIPEWWRKWEVQNGGNSKR